MQKTQKLIESDKVDFMVGYIWSNVLLASLKPLVDSKTFTDHLQCRRLADRRRAVLAVLLLDLLENDQTPQAMGQYMNQKDVKTAFLIGPNYAAGKDMLDGVASTFKGEIVGRN